MNSLGDYPLGAANDPKAPYNEKKNPETEIELCVRLLISKRIKVRTSDYDIVDQGFDGENYYCDKDFTNTNFWDLIEEEITPPEGWDQLDFDYDIIEWN